jgi:PAS domain S-box-containing protein
LRLSRPARITLGYLAVAAVWIFASDGLVALLATDQAALASIQTWKGTAFVLVTGLALYTLLRAVYPCPETAQQEEIAPAERHRTGMLAAAFVVLAAIIIGFGALAYRHQTATFKSHQYKQQTAIAELKGEQIERWVSWHRQEAEQLRSDPDLMEAVRQYSKETTGKNARHIRIHFEGLLNSGRWAGIGLYTPDGRPLLLTGRNEATDPKLRQAIAETAANGGFRLNDLHGVGEADYYIDFLVSIPAGPIGGRPGAVLVLSADPRDSLFQMAQSWPIPSASSETLLVRREGDEVVFLTPLRHAGSKPLGLRKPLTTVDLPAVHAVLQGEGVFEGVDYRGAPVLAAFRPVAGTAWHIVAKTGTEEVMQPLRQQAWLIFIVVLLAIGVTGLFVAFLWRGQQTAFAAVQRRSLEEREALAGKFNSLFQQARDSILLFDPAGRVAEANDAALAAYGCTLDEIRRLTVRDLRAAEAQESIERDFKAAAQPGGVLFETIHRRKDGSTFPVEVSARTIDIGGKPYRQSFIRDIGARKLAEEKNQQQLKELRQWYEATLDREDRVGQLKAEVNELRRQLGKPPRYFSPEAAEPKPPG